MLTEIYIIKWISLSLSLSLCLSLSLSLQRHYNPEWASASFKRFLHPSRFRATTVQFLHPSFAASSFTPSSQLNLGLPLGRFPPGSLRRKSEYIGYNNVRIIRRQKRRRVFFSLSMQRLMSGIVQILELWIFTSLYPLGRYRSDGVTFAVILGVEELSSKFDVY